MTSPLGPELSYADGIQRNAIHTKVTFSDDVWNGYNTIQHIHFVNCDRAVSIRNLRYFIKFIKFYLVDRFLRRGALSILLNATGNQTGAPKDVPEPHFYAPPSSRAIQVNPANPHGFPIECYINKTGYILRSFLKNPKCHR